MKLLISFLGVLGLWLLLFWSLDPVVVAVGVVLGLVASALLHKVCPDNVQKALNPLRWVFFLVYLPYFFYYCLKANLDVALRVLNPDIPIRPGIVKVTTTLTGEMAKTFLANSITLTPGTLTVDIDGQDLYIHWINISTEDAVKRSAEICGRFEPLLRRIFE